MGIRTERMTRKSTFEQDWKRVIIVFGIQSKQRFLSDVKQVDAPPLADMDENSDH